jgi:hypothetical protein
MKPSFKLLTSISLLVSVFLYVCSVPLLASAKYVPRFMDYPAGPVYRGKTHALLPKYKNAHPKTGIPDAAQRKADFAGHYVVIEAGCGAGCSALSVMDARTGKIYEFKHLIGRSDWSGLHYKVTSRLLVFRGELGVWDVNHATHGTYYYALKANHFVRLRYIHTKLK